MTAQVKQNSQIINLGVGQPDPTLLPVTRFQHGIIRSEDLAYGKEQGDDAFRELLAHWLSIDYQHIIDPDSLFVTSGCSNALDMLCSLFSKPGDTVFVEDPSYFIALKLFADHGLKIKPIPMTDAGIDLDALDAALQVERPAFLYCIPSYQNPTGVTIPESNRKRLLNIAQRYDLLIAADEVYQSLYFDSRPPLPLACYDTGAPVLSIGTFSKILAPGLRLGWIQTSERLIKHFTGSALLKSGGGLAPIASALVRSLLEQDQMQGYIENLRRIYKQRLNVLSKGLKSHCPALEFSIPEGGYFIWAKAKSPLSTDDLLKTARQNGVAFLPGRYFSSMTGNRAYIRLCFAFYADDELTEAAGRLGDVLSRVEAQ